MKTHELKILPEYFKAHLNGMKKFEVRKNDRGFQCFDVIILREWDGEKYTGRRLKRRITYVQGHDFEGIERGYVVLGTGEFFGVYRGAHQRNGRRAAGSTNEPALLGGDGLVTDKQSM